METNFFQTRFNCPKCGLLVRMNIDGTYEKHLCFEEDDIKDEEEIPRNPLDQNKWM